MYISTSTAASLGLPERIFRATAHRDDLYALRQAHSNCSYSFTLRVAMQTHQMLLWVVLGCRGGLVELLLNLDQNHHRWQAEVKPLVEGSSEFQLSHSRKTEINRVYRRIYCIGAHF